LLCVHLLLLFAGCGGGGSPHTSLISRHESPDGTAVVEVVEYSGGGAAGYAGTYIFLQAVPAIKERVLVADVDGSDPTRENVLEKSISVRWIGRRRCRIETRGYGIRVVDSIAQIPKKFRAENSERDIDYNYDFVFFEVDAR